MNTRYWNEYQKEIADDKYFYERSCIRQTFFPGSEAAFLKMLQEELGKDIRDEINQHTCTGIGYLCSRPCFRRRVGCAGHGSCPYAAP